MPEACRSDSRGHFSELQSPYTAKEWHNSKIFQRQVHRPNEGQLRENKAGGVVV